MKKDLAGKAVRVCTIMDSDISSAERKANKAGQVTLPLPFGGFQHCAFHLCYFLQSNWVAAHINISQHDLTYQREAVTDVRGSGKGLQACNI